MQLKHLQSIVQPSDGIVKVTAICWAPNGKRLAVCTTDRLVLMFDEDGNRKDKFSTKPADKVRVSFACSSVVETVFDAFCHSFARPFALMRFGFGSATLELPWLSFVAWRGLARRGRA